MSSPKTMRTRQLNRVESHRTGVTDDAAALEAAPRKGTRYRRKRGFLFLDKERRHDIR
jgi:hypothetical protein